MIRFAGISWIKIEVKWIRKLAELKEAWNRKKAMLIFNEKKEKKKVEISRINSCKLARIDLKLHGIKL